MRRLLAALTLAVVAVVGFGAQPAAAYNNAPHTAICNYVAQYWENLSGHEFVVVGCQNINFYGHYAVYVRTLTPNNGCVHEDVYDRHNGRLVVIGTTC